MTKQIAPVVVADCARNSSERIRVTLEQFAGIDIVSIRVWELKAGELKPSK
jgi:Transcriptional Coactivator p15 (PC4)